MTPLPKNSLTVPKRSVLLAKALLNSSCCSVFSTCVLPIALIVSCCGLHRGHSAFSSSLPIPLLFRHRWWKLCLHRKCTVGRSRGPPHEAQRRDCKTTGFVARSSTSAFFVAVSVR